MKLARIVSSIIIALFVAGAIALNPTLLPAQDEGGAMGSGDQGPSTNPLISPGDSSSSEGGAAMPTAPTNMRIANPITGSMMAAPPYGLAPMKVGFFVIANDPEGQGFLTYSWNFGDGTVSALPPELYIFHTYQNAGNYMCTLTVTTVDGRKRTFLQGVLVKSPGD